jgi:hypothetical protein
MMRSTAALFLGTLGIAGHAPASADVRAEYAADDRTAIVVEVAADGSARIQASPDGYLLLIGDREYWVRAGPGGPVALTAEALEELDARERRAGDRFEVLLEAEGASDPATEAAADEAARAVEAAIEDMQAEIAAAEAADPPAPSARQQSTFAGWNGEPVAVPAMPEFRLVVSDAAALAPLGEPLFRYWRRAEGAGGGPSLARLLNALRGKAPLAFGIFELRAATCDPLPASRYALPGDVVTLADLPPEAPAADLADFRAPSILEAVFWQGALWTRDDAGSLHRTSEGTQDRVAVDAPGRAGALCRTRTGLWVVTGDGPAAPLRLWTRSGAGWEARGEITVPHDATQFGVECSGERPSLFFGSEFVLEGGERSLKLDGEAFRTNGFATLLALGDSLYVGFNSGEWGGGLRRIDLVTGEVALVQAGDVAELCGGILNASCDPVTGLAPDPARPGCLLAAVGLVHFLASGEVVRVCGTEVERAYRKPYTLEADWNPADADEADSTVPFFGAAGDGTTAWAVGADGLYRFGAATEPSLARFGSFRRPGIDWSHPDVVQVPTDMNGRHSLSGGSLLLAPR